MRALATSLAIFFGILAPCPSHAAPKRLDITATLTTLPRNVDGPSMILAYRSLATDTESLTYVLLDDSSPAFHGPSAIATQIYLDDRRDPNYRVELEVSNDGCMRKEVLFYALGKKLIVAVSEGLFEPGRNSMGSPKRQVIRLFEPRRHHPTPFEGSTEATISYENVHETLGRSFICTKAEIDRAIEATIQSFYP